MTNTMTARASDRARQALLCAAALLALAAAQPAKAGIIDPAGDFLPTYTGAANGDMDVLAASVELLGGTLRFSTTLAGPVGTTAGGFYVWGIDRGLGTERFLAGVPPIGAGVAFDSVLILRPDGSGQFNDLVDGTNSVAISSGITISGNTIVGTLPTSRLVPHGFALDAFEYNVWPRQGAGQNVQISDFAPDAATFLADVPAPATVPLLAGALLGLAGLRRRASG